MEIVRNEEIKKKYKTEGQYKRGRDQDRLSVAGNPAVPFPEELAHLEETCQKIEDALESAEKSVQKLDREYRETKRYMAEYRGEIDPHEMFQTERLLAQTDRTGAFAVAARNRLLRLKESPYFARIDFCEDGECEPEVYYIGRSAFQYKNELLIFDWRAPVSGMFYDCEVGPAGFDAPAGRIEGKLTGKRQFKIKNGHMEYALETSANIQDDVLQMELSRTSDDKMKSIISTIQKEQNQIIRNERAKTLIIQGAAGSGKTSIALHRIAFLLYRLKGKLDAGDVMILSPNKVFGDYISNVIPELGEEPVRESGFEEIAGIQLEGVIGFQKEKDPLEEGDAAWLCRTEYKSTLEFAVKIKEYARVMPDLVFEPEDYVYGRFTAKKEWIRARYRAYGNYPVKRRLEMMAEDIRSRFETENIMEDDIPRASQILKSLAGMIKTPGPLMLYRDFYEKAGVPGFFVMPEKNTLEWTDVCPFLYLTAAFEGLKEAGFIKHLVVDEMQDYTPIQYAVLNLMFPCRKTILGDFGQRVNPSHRHCLEDLQKLYPDAEFTELKKSYRSTCEIIMFANGIKPGAKLEPVMRHGEKPEIISCKDPQGEIEKVRKKIEDFAAGNYGSLGIILRTNQEAKAFYEAIRMEKLPDCKLNLITPESTGFQEGVSVASVRMSKGLEFDQVMIPHADDQTYRTEYDRDLLYVACTRALHKLTVLYSGTKSRLLGEK